MILSSSALAYLTCVEQVVRVGPIHDSVAVEVDYLVRTMTSLGRKGERNVR